MYNPIVNFLHNLSVVQFGLLAMVSIIAFLLVFSAIAIHYEKVHLRHKRKAEHQKRRIKLIEEYADFIALSEAYRH